MFRWILHDLDGIVYYTSKLSNNITIQKPTNRIKYIKKNFDMLLNDNQQESYSNLIDRPYDYQVIAFQNIKKEFENNNLLVIISKFLFIYKTIFIFKLIYYNNLLLILLYTY